MQFCMAEALFNMPSDCTCTQSYRIETPNIACTHSRALFVIKNPQELHLQLKLVFEDALGINFLLHVKQ